MFEKIFERLNRRKVNRYANSSKTILIVDDSELDRQLIKRVIGNQGYKVLLAKDGQEGLQVARENKPDLIILDCDMPIMTGNQMCLILKKEEGIKGIPVLFLTSNDAPKNVIDCYELDAENYLNKPVQTELLISQVQSILS